MSLVSVGDVATFLEHLAPTSLAESWDNVGLLVGDAAAEVKRVMTCLTITPASAREAVERGAGLIVTHHPLPFRPVQRLTTATPEGRLLLELIAARVAVYSSHTGFDSAREGINQQLAAGLGLTEIRPLVAAAEGELGAGRYGRAVKPMTLAELIERVKQFLSLSRVQVVGSLERRVHSVAVACGSAGEFLAAARQAGCEALVTGEVRFHTCLEAEATGVSLVLAGHFASERFALERLAESLASQFSQLEVWASREECDPLVWV